MSDRKLYRQKKQAELDKWQAELDKLKAKASSASADAQLEMNKRIEALEGKIEEGKTKLSALAEANDDAWERFKDEIEATWTSLQSAFSDAAAKFKG
ncbi:MAG: coiled coil domain-containing protein [Planctomycetota bacterium]|nr:coiled coil domain-containing protein [Planctomycetota bacterium]